VVVVVVVVVVAVAVAECPLYRTALTPSYKYTLSQHKQVYKGNSNSVNWKLPIKADCGGIVLQIELVGLGTPGRV
jgi:hypothetical protein